MSFYIYILYSLKDHKFYTGFSANLRDRLSRHLRGEVTATRNRRPLKLIYYEFFINRDDAKAREVFLKSGFGRNNLKKSLQRTLNSLIKANNVIESKARSRSSTDRAGRF